MRYRQYAYPALVMFLVCLLVVVALVLLDNVTSGIISQNEKRAADEKRRLVLAADEYQENDGYTLCRTDGNVVGYIFVTQSEGYGGTISVMTGFGINGEITAVLLLSHSESKSLGDAFFDDFAGLATPAVVGENIESVTGVSVSAKAVAAAVNKARDAYLALGGDAP